MAEVAVQVEIALKSRAGFVKLYSSYVCQRTVSSLHNAYNCIVDGGLKSVSSLTGLKKPVREFAFVMK